MIKPSQINPSSINTSTHKQALDAIEREFDAAIDVAQGSGVWPAVVGNSRDGASPDDDDHVAQQYRDEGWIVVTRHRGTRAIIDHPARGRKPDGSVIP